MDRENFSWSFGLSACCRALGPNLVAVIRSAPFPTWSRARLVDFRIRGYIESWHLGFCGVVMKKLAILLTLALSAMWGQTERGNITGAVTDSTGAAVPG